MKQINFKRLTAYFFVTSLKSAVSPWTHKRKNFSFATPIYFVHSHYYWC